MCPWVFTLNPGKYIKQVKYRGGNWKKEPVRNEGSRDGGGDHSWPPWRRRGGWSTDLSSSDRQKVVQLRKPPADTHLKGHVKCILSVEQKEAGLWETCREASRTQRMKTSQGPRRTYAGSEEQGGGHQVPSRNYQHNHPQPEVNGQLIHMPPSGPCGCGDKM